MDIAVIHNGLAKKRFTPTPTWFAPRITKYSQLKLMVSLFKPSLKYSQYSLRWVEIGGWIPKVTKTVSPVTPWALDFDSHPCVAKLGLCRPVECLAYRRSKCMTATKSPSAREENKVFWGLKMQSIRTEVCRTMVRRCWEEREGSEKEIHPPWHRPKFLGKRCLPQFVAHPKHACLPLSASELALSKRRE